MEKVFAAEREALWNIILQQSQIMASLHKKSKHKNPLIKIPNVCLSV